MLFVELVSLRFKHDFVVQLHVVPREPLAPDAKDRVDVRVYVCVELSYDVNV